MQIMQVFLLIVPNWALKVKMFCKSVTLNVLSLSIPFELSILSFEGINTQMIASTQTTFCLCTCGNFIKLIARNNTVTIFKTIYLNNCKSQKIFANFGFNRSVSQAVNFITLSDSNYGLPVPIAIINFNN